MSAIPKARRSNVVDVTVIPANWDSHPEISRSSVTGCIFKDLSSSTKISRSEIAHSTIQHSSDSTRKGAKIERSHVNHSQVLSANIHLTKLHHSSVTDCMVERSQLQNCSVAAHNTVERTMARSTQFMSSKRVERSKLDDSVVMGESILERCVLRDSVVADKASCERSEINNTTITRSRIERSAITDCDIMDCKIERTDFNGMILKYGIWKRGELIGRTSKEHEVVIEPRHTTLPTADVPSPSAPELPAFGQAPALRHLGPGWKAAEAERERFMMEDDDEDNEYERELSELEASTDDEVLLDTFPSQTQGSSAYSKGQSSYTSTPAALVKGRNDPPPPYEK